LQHGGEEGGVGATSTKQVDVTGKMNHVAPLTQTNARNVCRKSGADQTATTQSWRFITRAKPKLPRVPLFHGSCLGSHFVSAAWRLGAGGASSVAGSGRLASPLNHQPSRLTSASLWCENTGDPMRELELRDGICAGFRSSFDCLVARYMNRGVH